MFSRSAIKIRTSTDQVPIKHWSSADQVNMLSLTKKHGTWAVLDRLNTNNISVVYRRWKFKILLWRNFLAILGRTILLFGRTIQILFGSWSVIGSRFCFEERSRTILNGTPSRTSKGRQGRSVCVYRQQIYIASSSSEETQPFIQATEPIPLHRSHRHVV